ncbi:hypothetical protein EU96_1776 [Prochlorococcus marinus str. MIT 9302]|uniref:Uncharacterized protein n=1 Tax=Prochlorococcus marinus str. MIT 9302 TaxID=74545 RepID=A0A0A2A6C3_PROMR|nr:hypothetical protein [Prochlorococcus marinus]KGF97135.1 hypothetical protein EU96_1776 [Prochlorococcus marinus str. MIT 9302]
MVNSDSWQEVEIGDQEIRPVSYSAFSKILKSYISDDFFGTFEQTTDITLARIADLADPDGWYTGDPDPEHWIYVMRLYKATSNKENLKKRVLFFPKNSIRTSFEPHSNFLVI